MKQLESMQSKSNSANRLELDRNAVRPCDVHSEPWWRGIGCNAISPTVTRGNVSGLSSPNGSESNGDQSLSNGRQNEEHDDAAKESQNTASSRSEHGNLQHASLSVATMPDDPITQPPQFELVGHSIACATNPYQDPYYGQMMAAYGHQPMGYPRLVGVPHSRMPLPLEMAQEPVYVNAKQYQGILRRRQARARAEVEKKLIKIRKPYLHESRHQHAMRRARGTGGRFAKKTSNDTSKQNVDRKMDGSGPAPSSQSGSSTGSEPLHSDSAGTWNYFNVQQEGRHYQNCATFEPHNYLSEDSLYHNHNGRQTSTYHSHSGGQGEDGDCSGQERGSISANQASQRSLTIQ
ncbi:hypothetical protein K2173_022114 [Erythroxylum novogranatense]|uniref:Nuclear transcription factor Y subunit n=1 Tax=Erythroxylum novogranatense TaxID=1862640 RepID=A0AAV8TVL8_9ROSI|nr:hypothetical protein K2173_022114 [Erythroxylum novogranatense]